MIALVEESISLMVNVFMLFTQARNEGYFQPPCLKILKGPPLPRSGRSYASNLKVLRAYSTAFIRKAQDLERGTNMPINLSEQNRHDH